MPYTSNWLQMFVLQRIRGTSLLNILNVSPISGISIGRPRCENLESDPVTTVHFLNGPYRTRFWCFSLRLVSEGKVNRIITLCLAVLREAKKM